MTEPNLHCQKAASLLKSLANANRLQILCELAAGECNVSDLNKRIPLSQSALSQHLAKLRGEGLVTCRKESLEVFYTLEGGIARQIIAVLQTHFCS